MNGIEIKKLHKDTKEYFGKEIVVKGWVRTVRSSGNVAFVEVSDGTFFKGLQVVVENSISNFFEVEKITIGSAVEIKGKLIESPAEGQDFELKAEEVVVLGFSDQDYPLQKKRHSFEFLRTIPHIRLRSNTFLAVFRLRSALSFAIHKFFIEKGFIYAQTPIISESDCEGAGEMFTVTGFDLNKIPKNDKGEVDFSKDFFGKNVGLTVSGQLQGEAMAMAFSKVYTFGPTFRAENSNTARHVAEFWMMEPEVAFADIADNMDLAEEMIKYVINYALETLPEEMEFFNKFIDKGILERLNNIVNSEFERITYTQAIEILEKAEKKFEYPVSWGIDLQSEHERYIVEEVYKKPVFVTDYPKEIKAFYMRLSDDKKTVAAMDLLVPGIGEIIGGSQREERLSVLKERMKESELDEKEYQWYLDTRRYGGVIHSGFGLGFERLIMYLSGMSNIRDVIISPRTPGNIDF